MSELFQPIHSISRIALVLSFVAGQIVSAAEPPAPVLPVPTSQQLAWQQLECIAFAHFGINTFTDREWGEGQEDPKLFIPTEFNADQWAQALKDAGFKLLILTAKHHDGFCLWPSQYTEHCVKNSPWRDGKGDVVKDVSEACRKAGIKFGVYLSPWDRNSQDYGNSPVYNEYFRNQLRELLTNYGPVTEVWFDGACGEGPNGKRQEYDFASYYEVVRELQPDAVIAIVGTDVRWVGNESGVARETEWSVQVLPPNSEARFEMNPTLVQGSAELIQPDADTEKKSLVWYPAECDVSIRPGWFYHADQDGHVKSLEHLLDIYYQSVGRNSVLLLNIPPDRRGLFHENDVRRLKELKNAVDLSLETDLALNGEAAATNVRGGDERFGASNVVDGDPATYWCPDDGVTEASLEIDLGERKAFDIIQLQEAVELGQRVAAFKLERETRNGWEEFALGTTIGYKRLLRFPAVWARNIRLTVLQSRGCPVIHTVAVYKEPPKAVVIPDGGPFLDDVTVTIESDPSGSELYYSLDGSEPSVSSLRYTSPFQLRESTTVKAMARAGFRTTVAQFVKCELQEAVMAANVFPGLNYTYYEGGWQSLQDMPHAQAVKKGSVEGITIEPRGRDAHFALAFDGFIRVPKDGIYAFYLRSDDGSRLLVGDTVVIDHDGLHGMDEKKGYVGLREGLHPIQLLYFNAAGDSGLALQYEGPDLEKQDIPSSVLFRVNKEQ